MAAGMTSTEPVMRRTKEPMYFMQCTSGMELCASQVLTAQNGLAMYEHTKYLDHLLSSASSGRVLKTTSGR